MTRAISLTVNGEARTLDADPDMPLLYALHDLLGLTGARYGCGVEQCGSCSVLVDGERVPSCATPVAKVEGKTVVTIEGLAGEGNAGGDDLHPLQKAFIDRHAFQCGYCTPGLIMAAKGLLDRNPDPSEAEIRIALQDNLCRCGSHGRIVAAVQQAAKEMAR